MLTVLMLAHEYQASWGFIARGRVGVDEATGQAMLAPDILSIGHS
ncbi:Unknown protein sequence [Pseudomonas coronafaciens pv. oryzae]|nr:Unknown protein sequence [Pseudomonas coronafaciens pv. oryzae]